MWHATDWTHKRATRNGDVNNHFSEHHRHTNHRIDWDSAKCLTYSTNYFQRLTLESWFTNLEQMPLNRRQQLPAPYKRLIDDVNKTNEQTVRQKTDRNLPMTVDKLYTSLTANHSTIKLTNQVQRTRLYNIIEGILFFTWLWRWLPRRLSKRHSPTTVLFRTTLTLTITPCEPPCIIRDLKARVKRHTLAERRLTQLNSTVVFWIGRDVLHAWPTVNSAWRPTLGQTPIFTWTKL